MPFDLLCCVRQGVEDVQELDYSHQSLTEVPSEVFVYERTLETLLCQCNRITELPRQLFMCHGLKYLDLSDNDLQSLPVAISSLVNLRHLNVSKNAIVSLPETMKALKHLSFLDLSVNPLEKLPDAITNLIALQELYLNDTYLEYLPGNFGRLANLRILELRDNYLMILPKSLARLTELCRLDIGQNEFQQFPEVIGKFAKLKELWIDSNSFTNIFEQASGLSQIIHLEASNNMIDELSPDLSFCTGLIDISLSCNNLTQLPGTIGSLVNVVTLKLDNNKLYDLPESIGCMQNLEELILMTNYLDSLPSSIGLLRKLQYLNVDENMLRSIPTELGSCSKLSVLSIRSNKLTSIPPEMGHLSNLRVLNLVRNSLRNLPATLLNCEKLVAVWLSENQSKPLVNMHTETDPETYQQVLTCYLFPQAQANPPEKNVDNDKSLESQTSAKHISFVDMKASSKVPEKPGQLRRAPTPYPKELRALAKHARTINKENAQDVSLQMPSAVHIKAAKITPTLQQRFASDNQITDLKSNFGKSGKDSPYENASDNPYDKPLNLDYNHDEKSYHSVNHQLYGDSHDYRGANKPREEPFELNSPSDDIVDGEFQKTSKIHYHEPHQENELNNLHQRHNISPQGQEIPTSSTMRINGAIYGQNSSDNIHPPPSQYQNIDSNYHGSVYDRESYALAKERMFGRRRFDIYNCQQKIQRELPRIPVINESVRGSTTMPNISQYENLYSGSNNQGGFSSSLHLQVSPNGNAYTVPSHSPTYSKTSELFSPTGHTNMTNPYRMSDTPLLSEDGSFCHSQHNRGPNTYSIYEHMPDVPPTNPNHLGEGQSTYGRQPPPYHIAAPYTKQAQYFNGTG